MKLQNFGRIDEEILWYVSKKGETRYTDLRNYLKRNGVCNEKTFVSHKKQLEASGLLQKKLSKKTYRPVYFIPTKVKRRLNLYLERQKTKRSVAQWVETLSMHELEQAKRAMELLSNPKVWRFLEETMNAEE